MNELIFFSYTSTTRTSTHPPLQGTLGDARSSFEDIFWESRSRHRSGPLATASQKLTRCIQLHLNQRFLSESGFLGDYRSILTPKMLEGCVCLKDWYKGEFKDYLHTMDLE